ncbi:MAG: hypothetical protein ABIR32_03440 [Ilumatobacteraceae bacterium]
MVAQAQFSTSDVNVAPGESETLELMLINLGNHTETFTLVPAGLLAGWVRLSPPTVTLFGGSSETITVTLRPPELATTPAGPAPLTVRIIPQDEPDDVIIAETTAVIGAFHDRRLHLLQPVVRSRRRGVFEFLVENQGNSQASCRLHMVDVSRRLDGDFDPPAVGVEPGGTSLVRLKMKAVRRQWRRGSRTLPFSIEADQQGFPTAVANATFVQTPVLPEHLGRRVLALAAVAGVLAGAWFGLLKPLTERTARDAVDSSSSTVIVTQSSTPNGSVTGTVNTAVTPTTIAPSTPISAPASVDAGVPVSRRLLATAAPDQSGTATATVPAGVDWWITDIVLQNTNDDTGLLTVLRNEDTIQVWNLGDSYANIDQLKLDSPILFPAGSVVSIRLDCGFPNGPDGQCSDAVLISGTEHPAG